MVVPPFLGFDCLQGYHLTHRFYRRNVTLPAVLAAEESVGVGGCDSFNGGSRRDPGKEAACSHGCDPTIFRIGCGMLESHLIN